MPPSFFVKLANMMPYLEKQFLLLAKDVQSLLCSVLAVTVPMRAPTWEDLYLQGTIPYCHLDPAGCVCVYSLDLAQRLDITVPARALSSTWFLGTDVNMCGPHWQL